jgi:hypothetical protein
MAAGKLGDKCPACGALRVAFEPTTDKVSERRRKILKLTLHPIAVHFPQTFVVAVLVLLFTPPVFGGKAEDLFLCTLKFSALFLPVLTAAAFGIGLIDGKTRFKKIGRSPILKRKIVLGILFFVFSVGLALDVWIGGVSTSGLNAGAIFLAVAAFIPAFWLGLLGSSIYNSEMPGD